MQTFLNEKFKFIRPKDLRQIFIGTSDSTFTKWANFGLLNKYKTFNSVFYKDIEVIQLLKICKEGTAPAHKINLSTDKFIRAKYILENLMTVAQSTLNTFVANGVLNRYRIGGGVYYLQADIINLPKICRSTC